jgi:TPR repeat protein
MVQLGLLYLNGQGVVQDYAKVREWFEKAADKGNADAMTNLGALYYSGRGVAQDYAKAREWFEKAADKGNADAMVKLGSLATLLENDDAKAREWFEKAAEKGDAGAMRNLGVLYANGQGVAQDYAKAREWYEKAAAKDDSTAMLNLGVLYAVRGLVEKLVLVAAFGSKLRCHILAATSVWQCGKAAGPGWTGKSKDQPHAKRSKASDQWFLARALIARIQPDISRRRAMASAV